MSNTEARVEKSKESKLKQQAPDYVDDLTVLVDGNPIAHIERYQHYYSIYWDVEHTKTSRGLLIFLESLNIPPDTPSRMGSRECTYGEVVKESVENPQFDEEYFFIRVDVPEYNIWWVLEEEGNDNQFVNWMGGVISSQPATGIIQELFRATTDKDLPPEAVKRLNGFLRRYKIKRS